MLSFFIMKKCYIIREESGGMKMEIKIFEDASSLDSYVADELCACVGMEEHPVLGFATGNTPCGAYDQCIEKYKRKEVDFSKVTAFSLDEYVGMHHQNERSFFYFMKTHLYDHINIAKENIYALNGAAMDMDSECHRYEELINKNPIDIQLLGIGMDGHIAYNEPNTPFTSITHVMELHHESIESSLNYGFNSLDEVPRQGVTMGIATIMKAKRLIMMAKGADKTELVDRMVNGIVCESFPSSIIQTHPNVVVVLDKEAASSLRLNTIK